MSKVYWTMKNGKKIDVDTMSENHLRNTLKMIIRNNRKTSECNINKRFIEAGIEQTYYDMDATEIDLY